MNNTFLPPERLVTSDFVIRSYLPGDGIKTYDVVQTSYQHLDRFLHWHTEFTSPDRAELLVREYRANFLKNEDFRLSVWSPDESEQWGGTGFRMKEGPYTTGIAEISMWIRASKAGQGLGTALLRAMVDWGFSEWGWRRMVWRVHAANLSSIRTAEKCGFHLSGTFRRRYTHHNTPVPGTLLYYDLLRSEWEASQEPSSGTAGRRGRHEE